MKRKDLVRLFLGIKSVGQVCGSAKWTYGLNKNMRLLRDEYESYAAAEKKFIEDREEKCKALADKNDKNEPVIVKTPGPNGQTLDAYKMSDDAKKELDLFVKSKTSELDALLGEDVKVELFKIAETEIPRKFDDTKKEVYAISPEQYQNIFEIVQE